MENLIIIVEDEAPIRRLLTIAFEAAGYKTIEAATGKEALVMTVNHQPSLMILDLGLPDMDGMEVLKQLKDWYTKPILVLSVRNAEGDIIHALDEGATDYLTKPFRTGELLARIRLALRRNHAADTVASIIEIGNLSIDIAGHTVKKDGSPLKLTSTEFALLSLFVRNSGRVLTHRQILKEIWGHNFSDQSQYLRVYVAQLRKKIEENPSKPTLLTTESRIGYRFGE